MGVPSDGVDHDQGKRGDDARQVLHPQQCSETAAEEDHAEGRHEAEVKAGMKKGSADKGSAKCVWVDPQAESARGSNAAQAPGWLRWHRIICFPTQGYLAMCCTVTCRSMQSWQAGKLGHLDKRDLHMASSYCVQPEPPCPSCTLTTA